LKAQKIEETSPVPFSSAVATLAGTAAAANAAPPVSDRLSHVQGLLADDLRWIEAALLEVAADGPAPGTHAARHLVASGGKRIRPIALLLSSACYGKIPEAARELAVVAELVHTATLLHDDVVDEGDTRRGLPTSRLVWGNAVSVLAGDLLLVNGLERTQRLAPGCMPELIRTLRRLVDGEIIQLRGRTELDVSEATYERILFDKTASLFSWATRTGAAVAGASAEDQAHLASFGERLGFAFQLVDDVIDYAGEKSGKTLFADLREGKLTLPLVLTVKEQPELLRDLKRIYAGDSEPVASVSAAVQQSGACDEVRRRAREYTRLGLESLRSIAPSPARSLLEIVATELTARAH
jgi:octaprenyl-diphosphate synthase